MPRSPIALPGKAIEQTGTLDITGKALQLPKDLDDNELPGHVKKPDKLMVAWPAAANSLQGVAGECPGAVTEVGVHAADKTKKVTPEQKPACRKADEAAYAFGRQLSDML